MSYMMVLTFDLKYPKMSLHGTNVYKKITDRLEELDIYKYCRGKRNRSFDLPSNTYLAEFPSEDFEKAGDLTQEIAKGLNEIFKDLKVRGDFFVFAGKAWAWKGRQFTAKRTVRN